MKFIDLTGQVFGRLTVIERGTNSGKKTTWRCRCVCGNETQVIATHLKSGHTQSCSCMHKESISKTMTTHGLTKNGKYPDGFYCWNGMLMRCSNPKSLCYPNYGGKGIIVCDRWKGENGLIDFLNDMGPRPTKSHSIGRMKNHIGYSPENCRWETKLQQGQNTSRNRNFTHNGKTQCLSAWSRDLGLGETGIHLRLKNGWSIEEALSTPKMNKGRHNMANAYYGGTLNDRWWLAD